MRLAKKIEVPPLSDAKWSRIERSLFDKLDEEQGAAQMPVLEAPPSESAVKPRAARVRAIAGVAIAFVAVAAAVLLVIGFAKGTWSISGSPIATAANPSRIVTGENGSHLGLGETSVDVAPESVVLASGDDDRGVLLVVDRGSVTCEVAPRRGRPPVVVQAGEVRVRVIGTRFTVARSGDRAKVSVDHGTVEVSAFGATTLVHTGESWPADGAAQEQPPAAPAPTTTATEEPAPHAAAPRRATTPRSPLAPDPFASAPPTQEEQYESAAQAESKDPDKALAQYRQLEKGNGAWAANALYAEARLQADRGNDADARRLLQLYLARYPQGANAADARALLQRVR